MTIDYNKNLLDVFRIIATVQVFLGHAFNHFGIPTFFSTTLSFLQGAPTFRFDPVYFVRCVPILFVLCGFLAAKSIEGKPAKSWLVSRAVRILPAFWVCILVNTIIILLVYHVKPTLMEGAIYGFTQFFCLNFYTGDWLSAYGTGVPNGVLWTIPVQIQFFLLVPLIHKLLHKASLRKSAAVVLSLTAMSVAIRQCEGLLPGMVSKLIGVTVIPFLYFLVLGMVVWYHRDAIIPRLTQWKWWLLGAYVVWKVLEDNLSFVHLLDGVMYNSVTTLLISLIIFAFAYCGSWRMKRDLTFGFYLYHMVFMNLALYLGARSLAPGGWWRSSSPSSWRRWCAPISPRCVWRTPSPSCLRRKDKRSWMKSFASQRKS